MNASQRKQFSREYTRINRAYEDRFLPAMTRAIQAKANRVAAAIKEGGLQAAYRFLSADIGNPAVTVQVREIYRIVGLRHARRTNAILRREPMVMKRLGFNEEWTAFILDYLQRYLFDKVVMEINNTTRDALLRAINNGVAEGLNEDAIYRLLQGSWPYARFQAARIIRTEVNRAANVGSHAANSTFEYEQTKEWIAVGDARTRGTNPKDHADHLKLDGKVVDDNEHFTDPRNGDLLLFPGDPEGGAASTINCRCTVAYLGKRDANGRLIPKNRQRRVSVILPGELRRPQIVTI